MNQILKLACIFDLLKNSLQCILSINLHSMCKLSIFQRLLFSSKANMYHIQEIRLRNLLCILCRWSHQHLYLSDLPSEQDLHLTTQDNYLNKAYIKVYLVWAQTLQSIDNIASKNLLLLINGILYSLTEVRNLSKGSIFHLLNSYENLTSKLSI